MIRAKNAEGGVTQSRIQEFQLKAEDHPAIEASGTADMRML